MGPMVASTNALRESALLLAAIFVIRTWECMSSQEPRIGIGLVSGSGHRAINRIATLPSVPIATFCPSCSPGLPIPSTTAISVNEHL